MPSEAVKKCCKVLLQKELSIAFAESATGGRCAAEFALIPKSGQVLQGGVVCYDGCVKRNLLKVQQKLIDQYTPESAEVTEAMAEGLKELINADIIVANTGLASPGGSESAEKPVGTMFIHLLVNNTALSMRKVYSGKPEEIVLKTIDDIALLILEELKRIG